MSTSAQKVRPVSLFGGTVLLLVILFGVSLAPANAFTVVSHYFPKTSAGRVACGAWTASMSASMISRGKEVEGAGCELKANGYRGWIDAK